MWWELGCPCLRSGEMACAALGSLCCASSEQNRNLSLQLVLSCGCLGSWQLWKLCQGHAEGWLFLGPYRYRPKLFSVSWLTVLPSQAAGVAAPQVSETLSLRGCKWGSSGKGRAASKSCSSHSPIQHCWERSEWSLSGVQTFLLMECEGWRGVQQ